MMHAELLAHGIHAHCLDLLAQIAHLGMGVVEAFLQFLILLTEFPVFISAAVPVLLGKFPELLLAEGNLKVFHFEIIINAADLDLHNTTSFLGLKIFIVIHLYIIQVKSCRFTIFIMEPYLAP